MGLCKQMIKALAISMVIKLFMCVIASYNTLILYGLRKLGIKLHFIGFLKINLDPWSDSSNHLLPKCVPSSDFKGAEREKTVAAKNEEGEGKITLQEVM